MTNPKLAPRRAIAWASVVLAAGSAGACTNLLGGFDFDGPAAGGAAGAGGSSSSSSSGSTGTSTSSTSSSSGATSCDAGVACGQDADCPIPQNECVIRKCVEGCCTEENVAVSTPAPSGEKAGDCHKAVCDGHGQITQAVDDTDEDDGEQCTDDACDNGTPFHMPVEFGTCDENGGKLCGANNGPWAGQCVECLGNGDCASPDVCLGSTCGPANCADGVQNGGESDVDCGGPCPPCDDGMTCYGDADCLSTACVLTGFDFTCAFASCVDGIVDGTELGETDVDCGGPSCGPCATGKACLADSDCAGGVCQAEVCAPTCTDGIRNQGESDVDCGGPCAKKCDYQKQCATSADCLTGFCNPNLGSCDAEILAQNQLFPQAIAVDGTNVYWTSYAGQNVMKLKLGTNTPVAIATGEAPDGMVIDASWPATATYVYWTTVDGTVKRRRVDLSAAAETLATGQNVPGNGIAVNGANLFWENDGDGSVHRATLTGASPTTLTTVASSFDQHLVLDGSFVYWTHPKSMNINKIALGGGPLETVASSQKPVGIAVDQVSVYWSDAAMGTVHKVSIFGGNTSQLATGLSSPWALALDSNNVYTYENVPNVARLVQISTVFGGVKVLVSGMDQPGGIAVDSTWVYFTNGDNTVRRVLKQ